MMITIKIRVFRMVIGFYVRLKKVHNLIFFRMILQNFVMCCVHHSICIYLFYLSTCFNVFGFIGTAVLVYDLCVRYDLTWRLSTILKSHESAHFPALYGPTTFTAINFIAITFNANINADDALKSNL